MAKALLHENRAVFDLEGGVRLPHSDEQDPFRALRFLVPTRLEGMGDVVDGKAGGLADARHMGNSKMQVGFPNSDKFIPIFAKQARPRLKFDSDNM